MIENSGIYYLYRHIREDKNTPFYVGIGTKPKKFNYLSVEFNRAYNRSSRNSIWKRIVNKTEFIVEILFESNDYDFIKEKEIEFIKLYGRIDLGTGTLVNLTDGGEGNKGYIASLETRKRIGLNNSFKGKFGKDNTHAKRLYQYNLDGNFIKEWDTVTEANRFFNTILKINGKSSKGFQWRYKYCGEKINEVDYTEGIEKRSSSIRIPVYKYNLNGNFITRYNSLSEAILDNNLGSTSRIIEGLRKESGYSCNYLWFREYRGEKIVPTFLRNCYKIAKCDDNGNIIQIYKRPKEVMDEFNLGRYYQVVLNKACNLGIKFNNFKWRYVYDT